MCADIWSNILLSVSMGVSVVESNTKVDRLNKADCLTYGGWASSNQVKAYMEQKGRLSLHRTKRKNKRILPA